MSTTPHVFHSQSALWQLSLVPEPVGLPASSRTAAHTDSSGKWEERNIISCVRTHTHTHTHRESQRAQKTSTHEIQVLCAYFTRISHIITQELSKGEMRVFDKMRNTYFLRSKLGEWNYFKHVKTMNLHCGASLKNLGTPVCRIVWKSSLISKWKIPADTESTVATN